MQRVASHFNVTYSLIIYSSINMINLCLESVLLFLACYVSILYAVIPVFENISKWLLNGTLFFVLFPFFWQTSDDAVPQPVVLRSWCNHCAAKFWRPSEGTPCTWYGMIFLCWECIFAWSGPDFEMFCFCDLWVSLYQKTILCWHLVFADEGTQGSSRPWCGESRKEVWQLIQLSHRQVRHHEIVG